MTAQDRRRRGGRCALDPRLAGLRRQIGEPAWADRVTRAQEREQVVLGGLAFRQVGVSSMEASLSLGVTRTTMERWTARYRRAGLAGLIDRVGRVAVPRLPGASARRTPRGPQGRKARSFVKWAGSKGGVMDRLLRRMPAEYGTYYEPMVGAGTVFFALRPHRAVLGDVNAELITCYQVIRDQVELLVRVLARHRNTYEHFLRVRAQAPEDLDPVARTARFIYLNKTCYNGLYRVNSHGRFNVPYGHNPEANCCDRETLRRLSAQLQGVTLRGGDYRATLAAATARDLVYLDPPYYAPRRQGTNGSHYQPEAFDAQAHRELADVVHDLDRRGCHVMVSNADAPAVRRLYAGFDLESLRVRRPIHWSPDRRDGHRELLITNVRPVPRYASDIAQPHVLIDVPHSRLAASRRKRNSRCSERTRREEGSGTRLSVVT
ncbi:MAG: Dam family site-specific DNA-(adenine-N6)-methyltransferase [Deltaproteobacteria bacterium]|nr:Dam family site-specific DNA-(adenine-N6)-methyltransferase [Deltaproteobacteria bacterium]